MPDLGSTNPLVRMANALQNMGNTMKGWRFVSVASLPQAENTQGISERFDLCEDCVEVLLRQFMVGAEIAAITQPPGRNPLPHDDILYQDCLLAFDPERGGLICEHDDPARFQKLCVDRAQNVAEGVPELRTGVAENVRGRCVYCGCTPHLGLRCSSTGCECLVSTDGENLTAAYSEQEPAE